MLVLQGWGSTSERIILEVKRRRASAERPSLIKILESCFISSTKALQLNVVQAPQVRWSIPYRTHSWLMSRPVWAYNRSYI